MTFYVLINALTSSRCVEYSNLLITSLSTQDRGNNIASNSEAHSSELLENLKDMFFRLLQ